MPFYSALRISNLNSLGLFFAIFWKISNVYNGLIYKRLFYFNNKLFWDASLLLLEQILGTLIILEAKNILARLLLYSLSKILLVAVAKPFIPVDNLPGNSLALPLALWA